MGGGLTGNTTASQTSWSGACVCMALLPAPLPASVCQLESPLLVTDRSSRVFLQHQRYQSQQSHNAQRQQCKLRWMHPMQRARPPHRSTHSRHSTQLPPAAGTRLFSSELPRPDSSTCNSCMPRANPAAAHRKRLATSSLPATIHAVATERPEAQQPCRRLSAEQQ